MSADFPCNTAILNGEEVDIAPLATINFTKLAQKDAEEAQRLYDACVDDGFFYLDLQGPHPWNKILPNHESLLRIMEKYFERPHEEKMKDDIGSMTDGFKPIGKFAGVNRNTRDCYETLRVSRANVVDQSPTMPLTVKENAALFHEFVEESHYITQTILTSLSDAMNLEGTVRFENSHRGDRPSTTTLVLLHYPKNFDNTHSGHNKHTDIGSLTLLFTPQWGLQLLSPIQKSKSWLWVEPRPGHAVINVGDSLRFLSGKRLKSCLHRVYPTGAGYQEEDRYSVAYFLRPESGANFEDVDGNTVSAKRWHDEKYVVYTQTHEKQEMGNMLTGGMEQILAN